MIRVAEEKSITRKLTAITKGNKDGALDRIEIATHDRFHSNQTQELYHYEERNFEAYPKKEKNKVYTPTICLKCSQTISRRYL